MKILNIFVFVIVILSFTSCYNYIAKVNSIGDYNDTINKNYFLAKSATLENTSDVEFNDLSQWLVRGLKYDGYKRVSVVDSAQLVIVFNYNVSAPEKNTSYVQTNHYGQTGQKTTTTVIPNAATFNPNPKVFYTPNTATTITTTTSTYGVVGSKTIPVVKTTYPIYISVEAFKCKDYLERTNNLIWKTEIFDNNTINDLRKEMPYYIFIAKKYFGRSTNYTLDVVFNTASYEFQEFFNQN